MILINLLPHREEKRRLRKQAFFVGLGMAAIAGLVLVA
ncbi:MAG TPA: fimbrial assembly protein, partial [Aquabacterium sp.]|nr:fimbrial assembly protein [Aquabacterium sp.]